MRSAAVLRICTSAALAARNAVGRCRRFQKSSLLLSLLWMISPGSCQILFAPRSKYQQQVAGHTKLYLSGLPSPAKNRDHIRLADNVRPPSNPLNTLVV